MGDGSFDQLAIRRRPGPRAWLRRRYRGRPVTPVRDPTEPSAADLRRRVRIGLTGLGGVTAAILVAGALVSHTTEEVMANATRGMVPANSVAAEEEAQPNDPLAGIGAAPAAKPVDAAPVEAVPGTGAVVDPMTGNVSDLPPS